MVTDRQIFCMITNRKKKYIYIYIDGFTFYLADCLTELSITWNIIDAAASVVSDAVTASIFSAFIARPEILVLTYTLVSTVTEIAH